MKLLKKYAPLHHLVFISFHVVLNSDTLQTFVLQRFQREKIFSSVVAKFGPNVIHDSVCSASHTVVMEHYIALIECIQFVDVCLFVSFLIL